MKNKWLNNQGSMGSLLFDVGNYLFTALFSIIMIYPLINIIAISLSSPDAIMMGNITWLPKSFNVEGYKLVLQDKMLLRSYLNTVIYAGLSTVFTLLFTSLLAYPLSIQDFFLRKFITVFLSITIFFDGGLIPTYLLIKRLGMIDTVWAMVIPGCVVAWNVIMFRSFFQEIPAAVRESAYIDGANDIVILVRIVLPMSHALLATFALFTIVGQWNDWFNALIYLSKTEMHPIQMVLRKIMFNQQLGSVDAKTQALVSNMRVHPKNIMMAAVVFTVLPILAVYPYLQKYFIKGVSIGSLKG